MSLEHFKTQVLLLHSQQNKLDILSTGFNDRYAVHIATSGAEALNTLGETPIHVIVSAQDLPGMSGLDAIREAKKRSPDTIGILLAGTNQQDGLEALVGDREVYQIVRGEISPQALVSLIEAATKRVRLLAISESANDQAANVDEPASEHIVMETLDNGSAVVSDGTGQRPALKPKKIQPLPDIGGRGVDVLVLTKDEEFLYTIRDSSREMHSVHHAITTSQAQEIVRNNKVGVLVTDAAMAGSNIETITQQLRTVVPRMVAVVAGRRDDGELLMDLINRGHVYRFLLKPVSPGRARLAIEASVKHHLEADDSAFRNVKPAAPAPVKPAPEKAPPTAVKAPKAAAKPAASAKNPKAAATGAARSKPGNTALRKQAANPTAIKAATPAPRKSGQQRRDPTISTKAIDVSPLDDGLDDAFRNSGSFTETMTGLAATVGKSLKGSRGSGARSRAAEPAALQDDFDAPRLSTGSKVFGVAALLVTAGVGYWMLSGSSPQDAEIPSADESGQFPQSVPKVVESDISFEAAAEQRGPQSVPTHQVLLEEARIARNAGEIVGPPGSSAVELYVAAREAAPGNATIVAELDATVEQVLGIAESAILGQRLEDAGIALQMVVLANPDNPRLGFLNAQLTQLRLREAIDQARVAIREGRFEDASSKITEAQSLTSAELPEIAAIADELNIAKSEQQVDEVMALAAQRLDDGRLIAPANNNARYYYELALGNDPQNAAARQGMVLIAGKLVLQAREAMDNGQLDAAESLLRDARALDPSGNDLSTATRALENARNAEQVAAAEAAAARQRAAERERRAARENQQDRGALLAQQAESERLANLESQDAARRAAAAMAMSDIESGFVNNAASNGRPVAQLSSGDATVSGNRDVNGAAVSLATLSPAATDQRGSNAQGGTVAAPTAALSRPNVEPEWVGVSSLTRVNYVAPKYPRIARRKNVTGSVDVSFIVSTNGEVRSVEVLKSTPGTIFDEAAVEAVSNWRFEPVFENGAMVEKRSAVRLAFDLE